ncbi:fungal-specific transcription factor domain-containing protein [Tricladium varicosporioides]|nr:fungal-specific transcription factor domain-containing protein [Hymenoscyphus varicosporioides]
MRSPSSPTRTASNSHNRTRRTLRVRVACLRCQRRKIRCDGVIPSCGSCSKGGVECIDGGKLDGIDSPRAYIASLKSRIQWLESIIQTNCPDIDLAQGPRLLNESGQNDVADIREPTQNNISLANPQSLVQPRGEGNTPPCLDPSIVSTGVPPTQEVSSNSDKQTGLAHEIGLVSLSAGTDPKYIGPSSGYFFAKLVLACARQSQRNVPLQELGQSAENRSARLFPQGTLSVPPTPLPESIDYTVKISEAYFETIHLQYPFLHRPSHMKLIEHLYTESEPRPIAAFQVYMVLAIGATVLSRRLKISLSGDGFCASAMRYFDKFCIENSLKGLQSLLLLLMYTLNSSSMGLNVWYLNYQCIAALLDLGLQRDVRSGKTISVLDQELRTRAFWVIYSLDRSVATMMGRPIGLRDEACELRLPADVEDSKLSTTSIQPRLETEQPTHMSSAIHLFKLAQLNSEMKYVLHSISHEAPPYTYPSIPDVLQWQRGIATRLREWFDQIPQFTGDGTYMIKICEIKYHSIMMLLLRPSPAIPNPSIDSLTSCYESAVASIRLYDQLYKDDLLVYSWVTIHSIFLSTITMLHCIWTVPEVSTQVKLDVLVADLKAGSNVLSATGEHWSEAKRSRDVLDELSGTTIRWIIESRARGVETPPATEHVRRAAGSSGSNVSANAGQLQDQPVQYTDSQPLGNYEQNQEIELNQPQGLELNQDNQDFGSHPYIQLFGDDNLIDQIDFTNPAAVNAIMHGVFTDFQPIYDFGQDFEIDQIMGGQR